MFSYKKQNKKTDEIFNWGVLVCLNGQEDEKKEIQEKKKKEKRRRRRRGKLSRNERNLEYLTCQLGCELQSSAVIPSFLSLYFFFPSYITVDYALNRETERERDRDRGLAGQTLSKKLSLRTQHIRTDLHSKNNNKNISKIKSEMLDESTITKKVPGDKNKQTRETE